jgi:hypothetical protein
MAVPAKDATFGKFGESSLWGPGPDSMADFGGVVDVVYFKSVG